MKPKKKSLTLPKFPLKILVYFAIIILSMMLYFIYYALNDINIYKNTFKNDFDAIKLSENIMQNEALAVMTTRFNIVTDDQQKNTKDDYINNMLTALDKAASITTHPEETKALLVVKLAANDIVALGNQAKEAINKGDKEKAMRILFSNNFLRVQNDFMTANNNYLYLIKERTHSHLKAALLNSESMLLFLFCMLFAYLIAAVIVFQNFYQWKKLSASLLKENLIRQNELETIKDSLEQRVQERTSMFKQKNEELIGVVQELHTAQQKLVEAEKMATVGQLAAGIAHEINNPLSYAVSNMHILSKRTATLTKLFTDHSLENSNENVKNPAEILAEFDEIITESKEGLDRIKRIISNLRDFAGTSKEEITEVDINACIESAVEFVWNELKYKCNVHKNFGNIPSILGYPNQLKSVFINLLLNAAQAINEKGDIYLTTTSLANEMMISIRDSGCGITEENMRKIFTPFFTTKPINSSCGLGLATAYGIVHMHEGTIKIESEPNIGTTVTIYLPLVSSGK